MKKIEVIFRKAILYTKKGDIERAIIEYKKVLQMNENLFRPSKLSIITFQFHSNLKSI